MCMSVFFFLQLRAAINSRERVLLDRLVSLHQSKESILTGQLERLRLNEARLEGAVEQANSSIQSPSDVNFLLSRPAIVSALETNESYSLVLEPEAQFFSEFKKEEKVRFQKLFQFQQQFKATQHNFPFRPDFQTCWVPEDNIAQYQPIRGEFQSGNFQCFLLTFFSCCEQIK